MSQREMRAQLKGKKQRVMGLLRFKSRNKRFQARMDFRRIVRKVIAINRTRRVSLSPSAENSTFRPKWRRARTRLRFLARIKLMAVTGETKEARLLRHLKRLGIKDVSLIMPCF